MSKHPELQEGYIYCEFLRFSVFLMSMSAFNCGMSAEKFAKLKEAITLLIVHPTVDTFFAHVRDPVIETLIYDTLSNGDVFYGSSLTDSLDLLRTSSLLLGTKLTVNR
jgi:hypothetical protein